MEPMRLLVTDAAAQPPRQATAWLIMTLGGIMKSGIVTLFVFLATIALAVPPPIQRPIAPRVDVASAARLASAEAQKIDPHYYCISANYVEASLIRKPNDPAFPSRHWRIILSLPGDDLTMGTNKDILVLVSEDGKEIKTFKNPAEAIYQI